MATIDSLLGILDLQQADGMVLMASKAPTLLGGKGGGVLTMPPLGASVMAILVDELLTPDERRTLAGGAVVERPLQLEDGRQFALTARLDNGQARIVVRRRGTRTAGEIAVPARAAPATAPPDAPGRVPAAGGLPVAMAHALDEGIERRVSDVILSVGRPPLAKRDGRLEPLQGPALTEADVLALVAAASNPEASRCLAQGGSVDFALVHGPRRARFRVNVFRQWGGLAAVLRPIWDQVPTLEALGLPRSLVRAVAAPNGLVLMAGATGSGKSTTLAALIEHVAETRPCHIVTLEDPIEYVYGPRRAVVHQREVGAHVESFAAGLRAALRESPDVLSVGEMRDHETIALALTAAETGHLVLSTLHAGTAAGAIERIVGATPESQRGAVRFQLASALRFVLTQQLLPATEGGRVPAVEVMVVNHAIAAQIREGRTQLLTTQIELGSDEGMVTMDQAVVELFRAGRITRQTALAAAQSREGMEKSLTSARAPSPTR